MKKFKILVAFILFGSIAHAQLPPLGSSGNSTDWRRGGNNPITGNPPNANIFGTMYNSPIYTYTDGVNRARLNGTLTAPLNGVNQNVSGFMGLAPDGFFANNTPITLLHLQGPNNTPFGFGGGWRRWMSTGIFIGEHSDGMYVGMKPVAGTTNRSNAVINWNDDPFTGVVDKLSFVFTQANNGNGTGTNPINSNSLNGYEFMLLAPSTAVFNSQGTGEGTIGVGPVFTDAAPPQSRFHMNAEERMNNWLQISNQTGTGQTANDGLRIGIHGNVNPNINGNALIYNQETRHLLFSTASNTNVVNFNTGNTLERMRITSISAPTNLATGAYGVYNPGGLAANLTRVAISHNPNSPVTRPLSLLHLGYNTGQVGFTPTSTDGWRDWMDIGTFTSNGTDNMYVGLKAESGGVPANDRYDAVINWGDNGGNNLLTGSDNLRFIFTETTTSTIPGNPPATSNNGLEVARFDPKLATTLLAPNYGMMGIGDWTTPVNIANPINAKLDIDGDLRIKQVTQDNTLIQLLAIDPTDHNRVHWVDATSFTGGGFGSLCGSATPSQLTGNSEIQLNNFDFHFTGNGGTMQQNNVGIGTNCQTPLAGKLHVNRTSTDLATTAAYILNNDASNSNSSSSVGLFVKNSAVDVPNTPCRSVAGWFETVSDPAGETGFALYVPDAGGRVSIGFGFNNMQPDNNEPDICGLVINSGALLEVNGDIYTSGLITGPSDISFKKNITPIINALDKVKKLNGVYYDYDNTNFPNLNFSTDRQVGLIAQNVDSVLTEVTQYDSTLQAFTMDYSRINALLIEAIKEQQNQIDSMNVLVAIQDSINTDLEDRLVTLEACINNIGLCNNNGGGNGNKISSQSVMLENLMAIVLDQNLPNPFAESTQINYVIPDDVLNAKLLFYDMSGRIINEVNIYERGNGVLTVYGENLEKGIYTYSLIADGKLIATKKMVKK
ncbi:MAG: tail fiber domain-containing protein [Vicingaceae bacterium]|nr:tail fiber domain-containing protein [Vicingaceae bacterium]